MIGIAYRKIDNQIMAIIPNVLSASDTEIIGVVRSIRGIDTTNTGVAILAATGLKEGDILGSYVDVRDQLPKSDKQKIEELEAQIAFLQGKLNT